MSDRRDDRRDDDREYESRDRSYAEYDRQAPRRESPRVDRGDRHERRGDRQDDQRDAKVGEVTIDVEEAMKRVNGDIKWQALINIPGVAGRIRTLRGPPRVEKARAWEDGDNMKSAYASGGVDSLRKKQQELMRSKVH